MKLRFFRKAGDFLTRRLKNPQDRYIHLDGSPYRSHGLTRFLTTPVIKYSALASLFETAALAMTLPPEQRASCLSTMVVSTGIVLGLFYNLFIRGFFKPPTRLDNAAIDKTGTEPNDPQNLFNAIREIKQNARVMRTVAPAFVVLGVVFGVVFGIQPIIPSASFVAVNYAYQQYVKRKLSAQKWTIQAAAPKL
jgi:hypothetical protein